MYVVAKSRPRELLKFPPGLEYRDLGMLRVRRSKDKELFIWSDYYFVSNVELY